MSVLPRCMSVPGIGVIDNCKGPQRCWEPNLGLLEDILGAISPTLKKKEKDLGRFKKE